ncbi:MAG TPA: methionine--tRNA ligase [Rhodanobacteraceae bacterium]|nr:methionine--tRNA ligase [Rhodanobacteraceae bacterium]
MKESREILVTHALPYANGPLHIGHLLGYIQSDIWVRARRMGGDKVHFVAADDVHGTPIMLAAEKAGMTPEEFIKGMQISHERDFADFGVAHDYYYTTHSPENQELAELVYRRLRDAKPSHIATKSVRQFYDPVKQMFLPDRYIKGECPNCGTPDQYGDNCENCGATYAPTDLKNPRSVVSGATPELRDSEHYFFKVGDFTQMLRDWFAGKLTNGEAVAHSSVAAKLKEWLDAEGGVRDWDISRDAPYFGFPIPDAPGKFFYVWLDAPIGYLAAFKKYCASEQGAKNGLTAESFDRFMQKADPGYDPSAEMHHFLGKDIVNFHGLFWPAMLEGAKLRTPNKLYVNGYLGVNGAKMSKSRGTFIQARTYLDAGLNPEYLRYYFATMLGPGPTDVDLDLKAFVDVTNSHIVGKFVNIASRCAKLLEAHFENILGDDFWSQPSKIVGGSVPAFEAFAHVMHQLEQVPRLYESAAFSEAAVHIVRAADHANEYIAQAAPWALARDETRRDELRLVLTAGINMFRMLACALRPIIPSAAAWAAGFLAIDVREFTFPRGLTLAANLANRKLARYEPLLTRIDPKQVESMIELSKESMQVAASAPPSHQPPPASGRGGKSSAASTSPLVGEVAAHSAAGEGLAAKPPVQSSQASAPSPQPLPHQGGGAQAPSAVGPAAISIDDFAKLDLRIGKVLQCEFVEGSDKLLRFELDAGELGKRQIFSGIRAAYQEPAKLVGRHVVFIANLAPRKMRFGVSEGMILSAGSGGDQLFLLDADSGAAAGMPIK